MNVAQANKAQASAGRSVGRLAIFTCAMLVLGLITTVAVAWLCAWFMPLGRMRNETTYSQDQVPRWIVQTRSLPGVVQVEAWFNDGEYAPAVQAPPAWSGIRADPGHQVADDWSRRWSGGFERPIATAAGWPALALTWRATTAGGLQGPRAWTRLEAYATPTFDSMIGGALHDHHGRQALANGAIERVLPLTPIVSGLTLNTAVYATVWALMLTYWRAGRRLQRVASERCACCRYSLRGLPEPRCPECGALNDRAALRRDRAIALAGRIVTALAGGCAITVAIAWTCSALVRFEPGASRLAWQESARDWLLNRLDGFGSVRVAWLYDEATAEAIARTGALRDSVRSQIGPPLHSRQLLAWMEERLEARMQALQKIRVDGEMIPTWMERSHLDASHMRPSRVHSLAREGRGWPLPALGLEVDVTTPRDVLVLDDDDVRCGAVAGALPLEPFEVRRLSDPVGLPLHIIWRGFVIDSAVFAVLLLTVGLIGRRLRARNAAQCVRFEESLQA